MVLTFKGQLLSVEKRKNKAGADYTLFKFNSSSGEDFSLVADGTVNIGAEYLRRDIDWILHLNVKVFGYQTSFKIAGITGDLGKGGK